MKAESKGVAKVSYSKGFNCPFESEWYSSCSAYNAALINNDVY